MTVESVTPELSEELKNEMELIKNDRDIYLKQLLDTRHELVQLDIQVENQKDIIENLGKVIKQYTKENEHLRELIKLWI